MKKNGDSRTSFLFEQPITITQRRHRPLIDPMVLIILILPILVLLFLFFLSYVPKSIKPTSFKSTFNSFNLFLVLLASLFHVLNHEDNESPTNKVVENYQDQNDIGVNNETYFYDAESEDWPMSDEAMDVAVNSDDQRTSTPPPVPWIHVNYYKLDQQVYEDTTERGSSDDQSYRDWKRKLPYRRKVKNKRRVAPYIKNLKIKQYFRPKTKTKNTLHQKPQNYHHDHRSNQKLNTIYAQQSSMSSSSQSSYIPQPPPPPPFYMPEMRYKYYGNFVRLRSFNSNTSSSPDIQPVGQPSTSMDGGDSFWSSPDVNVKAGIFISKGQDKWKMEKENTVKKKGGTSFINKPRKTNLNSMKSHFNP